MPIFLNSKLIHKLFYCSCILLFTTKAFSVSDSLKIKTNKYVVSANTQYGFIIVHRSSIEHFSQSHFSVFQASFLKQTTGNLLWHQLYYKPRLGFNFIYTNFAHNTLLHGAFGAQGFIDFCRKPDRKNSLHFKLGCGLGYIQTPFNRKTNFKNIAIGTHFNGLVQLGFYYNFKLNNHFTACAGASLIHFSNGAIKVPNLGINIASAGVALQFQNYKFVKDTVHFVVKYLKPKKYFEITLGFGIKQNYPPSSTSYGVVGLRSQYYFCNRLKNSISAGLDIFNDNGLHRKLIEDGNPNNNYKSVLQLGVNVQYQQNISRISIPIFIGAYAFSNYKGNGFLYHGLGVKYKLHKNISCAVILKTHYAKADYFLWSICYKFR